jgi:hypothetical protein
LKFVDLSHKNPKGRTGKEERENEKGEGDEGSLILFNRAITQSQFDPYIF